MKKSVLLLGAALFALASCGESGEYRPDFSDNPWGETAANDCYDAVHGVIPYLQCDDFEYKVSEDDYGDPMITFYLYYATDDLASEAFNNYATLCAENMYVVNVGENTYIDYDTYTYYTYEVMYADCLVGKNLGLEIVGTPSTYNQKPCLGLFVYNYLYIPENEYPELAIQEVLGKNHGLPTIEGDYTYKFLMFIEEDYNTEACEIQVYGCYYDLEEWYFNQLIEDGWYIMKCNDSAETYERIKEYDGYDLGYYYYAVGDEALVIFEYNFDNQAFIIDVYQKPADF